jgi:2-polyprenyl-3-methyl-5-hydroxy-6-metoxy-1,4-benzoquinol methylase
LERDFSTVIMSQEAFDSAPVFSKTSGPLTPSEIQWIYSGNGGGTPEEEGGPRVEKVRKFFGGLKERKKILDVGCANGAILKPLRQQHELHGVDISEPLIKDACANGFAAKVHDLMQGPLPYADGTFDIVFSGETIEHQVDTDWLLREFNRVLKPGGQIVLTFPNIRTPLGIAMLLFFDMPPMYSARYRASHFRDFTLRYVQLALAKHGFRHEKSFGSAFYLPKIGEFWIGLASILPSWSHTVITVARKVENSKYTPKELATDNNFFGQ